MKSMIVGLTALLATAVSAFAAEPAKVMDTKAGKIWTDQKGMTLYTFDKDEAGKSNCYDKCAVNWPPYMAEANAMAEGEWTVIDRTDGTKQWAYEGKPVYYFIQDKKAGDVTGDGKGDGTWHVIKADAM